MGLRNVVAKVVAIADAQTKDLQAKVQHKVWVSQTTEGVHTYKSPVLREAVVDWKQKQVRTTTGELSVSRAYILFPRAVEVDEKDILILPDGTTGPILDMSGPVDRVTGRGYVTEVWLG